jgi:thiamine biosynthesis lipoprotein ApbE
VVLPSATETDALSTALLVLGMEGHEAISRLRPDMGTLVVAPAEQDFHFKAQGIAVAGSGS